MNAGEWCDKTRRTIRYGLLHCTRPKGHPGKCAWWKLRRAGSK